MGGKGWFIALAVVGKSSGEAFRIPSGQEKVSGLKSRTPTPKVQVHDKDEKIGVKQKEEGGGKVMVGRSREARDKERKREMRNA